MHRDQHIARAVLKGYSNSAIARQHGLTRQYVAQIRRGAGLPNARVMPAVIDRYRRNPVLVERDETIIRMYQNDAPIRQIMSDLAVTRAVVSNVISKAGIAQDRHIRLYARNQRIATRYQEGASYKDLAAEFGITIGLVSNMISKAGLTNRRARRAPQIRHRDPTIAARNKHIVARYQEGASYKDLAKEFGITLSLAQNVISNAGVANRRTASNHGATP